MQYFRQLSRSFVLLSLLTFMLLVGFSGMALAEEKAAEETAPAEPSRRQLRQPKRQLRQPKRQLRQPRRQPHQPRRKLRQQNNLRNCRRPCVELRPTASALRFSHVLYRQCSIVGEA